MGGYPLLAELQARGFSLIVTGDGRLRVNPASRLALDDGRAIRAQRHALMVALVNPPIDSGLCPNCWGAPSLCPPYGWCFKCTTAAWSRQTLEGAG